MSSDDAIPLALAVGIVLAVIVFWLAVADGCILTR